MTHGKTLDELMALKTAELVGIHNGLNADAPLKTWKGKKGVLVDRIMELRAPILQEEPAADVPGPDEGPTAKAASGERTIREAALELLCRVVYYEDRNEKPDPLNNAGAHPDDVQNARSVGVPYDEIIAALRDEFPECQTSIACLRWYAVKVRAEEFGYESLRLPQRRPRVKPTKRA